MNDQTDSSHGKLVEIAATFLKLGALSYGGPAIMGIMQSEIGGAAAGMLARWKPVQRLKELV